MRILSQVCGRRIYKGATGVFYFCPNFHPTNMRIKTFGDERYLALENIIIDSSEQLPMGGGVPAIIFGEMSTHSSIILQRGERITVKVSNSGPGQLVLVYLFTKVFGDSGLSISNQP